MSLLWQHSDVPRSHLDAILELAAENEVLVPSDSEVRRLRQGQEPDTRRACRNCPSAAVATIGYHRLAKAALRGDGSQGVDSQARAHLRESRNGSVGPKADVAAVHAETIQQGSKRNLHSVEVHVVGDYALVQWYQLESGGTAV
jgi:hypothetical protein